MSKTRISHILEEAMRRNGMEPYGGLVKTMSGSGTIGPANDRKSVGYFLALPRVPGLTIKPEISSIDGLVSYGASPHATAYLRILTGELGPFDDGWFGLVHAYPAIRDDVELGDRIARTNGMLAEAVVGSIEAWLTAQEHDEAAD